MTNVLIAMVRFYRRYLSGLKRYTHCIYRPTCSEYAYEAIQRFGALRGGALALWRILRCNPFGGSGYDPVPEQFHLGKKDKH